jgi:hypothetical protein
VPTTYPYREYVERGGLMAYASDLTELGRGVADDVHQSGNKESEHDCIKLPAKHGCRTDQGISRREVNREMAVRHPSQSICRCWE